MPDQRLTPNVSLVKEEYVLIQAWKKASTYIRNRNSYSDVLALDNCSVNLPRFLRELAEELAEPGSWRPDPLRLVLSPKSQEWRVSKGPDPKWSPVKSGEVASKMRPLAHVSLRDQVATTALMLCLADRSENLQSDPKQDVRDITTRKALSSYGNRLFCYKEDGILRHPWGSAKLYRSYFQDYQTFIARPTIVARTAAVEPDEQVVVVHSDLSRFYDRVTPNLLLTKVRSIAHPKDDERWHLLFERMFRWNWSPDDWVETDGYAKRSGISDFSNVALPQGLVSAGFFANIVLLDFDRIVRSQIGKEVAKGILLLDLCRYVDDLRLVVTAKKGIEPAVIEATLSTWLQSVLDSDAHGLLVSKDKTTASWLDGDRRPAVFQSRRMTQVMQRASGGFGAADGIEIINSIEGLLSSQEMLSIAGDRSSDQMLSPIPDVPNDTVARFAAARYRTAYRSTRPLLYDTQRIATSDQTEPRINNNDEDFRDQGPIYSSITQGELDNQARAFAHKLVQKWIDDPSSTMLLRIGLDIWPAKDLLEYVLSLLRPIADPENTKKAHRRVAWYCLAELFKAGATETGFVDDADSLSADLRIEEYRALLSKEGLRLLSHNAKGLPWYLKQQILLYLIATRRNSDIDLPSIADEQLSHHVALSRFLDGQNDDFPDSEYAEHAVVIRRAFRNREESLHILTGTIDAAKLECIGQHDPAFACEILADKSNLSESLSPEMQRSLAVSSLLGKTARRKWKTLESIALSANRNHPLRNELTLLQFAIRFMKLYSSKWSDLVIAPCDVQVNLKKDPITCTILGIRMTARPGQQKESLYTPPSWCVANEKWRFQLGYLLRFVLAAAVDFSRVVKPAGWKEDKSMYRTPESHWYQRHYGFLNAHHVFGDDWLPISDWLERALAALLWWPGSRIPGGTVRVEEGIDSVCMAFEKRLAEIEAQQGNHSTVLKLHRALSIRRREAEQTSLHACIAQTAIPKAGDFNVGDLSLSSRDIRKRHRNHFSAVLDALKRMLNLRQTHLPMDQGLDLLILPELAVHPDDVQTHLVRFVRQTKTMVLAGLTYQQLEAGMPMVNSALWVVPEWSKDHGYQVRTYRQGKYHLSHDELVFNRGLRRVMGFRPCQWLIDLKWSSSSRPLRLTSAVCYDATDLQLASELRDKSDVFAVLALNRDVETFDQMAIALNYHMFQMVVVANNGQYGGSNAYQPRGESFERRVFHVHGQEYASFAFFSIDKVDEYVNRLKFAKSKRPKSIGKKSSATNWKYPPAGVA